jgi:hypothetical protein
MPFLDHVLQRPAYGWQDGKGNLVKPNAGEIFREFFSRLNVFKDRKNWLPFFRWLKVSALVDTVSGISIQYDHYGYTWHDLAPPLLYTRSL